MTPASLHRPVPEPVCARIARGVPVAAEADRILDRIWDARVGRTALTPAERAAMRRIKETADAGDRLRAALREAGREPIADRLVWTSDGVLLLSYLSRRERPGADPYAVGHASVDRFHVSFVDDADGLRVDEAWPRWHRLGAR